LKGEMHKQEKLNEYLEMPWHYSVAPSQWEGQNGYCAWVSELPDCSTFALTPAEALSMVAQLLPEYLKIALESQAVIPAPESRDAQSEDFGGTIVLRVPKSLHMGLKNAAKAEQTSLNQFALYALTRMVYQTNLPAVSSTKTQQLARKTSGSVKSLNGMLKKAGSQKKLSTKDMNNAVRKRVVKRS